MALFDFPYHVPMDEYPQSGFNVQFGRGYAFASAPRGPDQLIFHLSFEAMFFWYAADGVTLDAAVQPALNARRLQVFYETHRMYEVFTYQHPIRGLVNVRFNKPMPQLKPVKEKVMLDPVSGARGHQVEGFQIDLVLQP